MQGFMAQTLEAISVRHLMISAAGWALIYGYTL